MLSYILKRIALMLPTLLGALTLTFVVIQFVPGGPVEQAMAEARAGARGAYKARGDIDAKQLEELKKLYGFDKPAPVRYVERLEHFARFDLG
ncbi:MAG: microcin ABC transporter permease, partial [Burkholderiales bacterium]|nr:microcin ABC transporter permease [Burkholderiales bacterium]